MWHTSKQRYDAQEGLQWKKKAQSLALPHSGPAMPTPTPPLLTKTTA